MGVPRARELKAVSIGPVTSAELRRFGVEPAAEAERPGDEEMVAAVIGRPNSSPVPGEELGRSGGLALLSAKTTPPRAALQAPQMRRVLDYVFLHPHGISSQDRDEYT
jgi:hypothetical protein